MRLLFPAAVVAVAGLSACSIPTVDKEADSKARALYEQIRTGADLSRNTDLAPELRTPGALGRLAAVRQRLPDGAPAAATTRSWSVNVGTGGTTASVVHGYSYSHATVLAQTVLSKGPDKVWKITGFHVRLAGEETPMPPVTGADAPKDI